MTEAAAKLNRASELSMSNLKLRSRLAVVAAVAAALVAGCESATAPPAQKTRSSAATAQATSDALRTAIDLLADEEFDPEQALTQAGTRLHQWLISQPPDGTWRPDPMVKTVPEAFQSGTAGKRYDDLQYNLQFDGNYIRQCIWMKDVSTAQLAGQPTDLELGERLFDWTVRNIQLEASSNSRSPKFPWYTLLIGRGSALERAWTFILLGRQQGLDVAMLELPGSTGSTAPMLVGLLVEGEIYLFEPNLGLRVPGPGGEGIATLKQAIADDSLLRQFDLPERPYPLNSETLKGAVALIEASPFALSRRMQLIETQLGSEQRVVLAAEPSEQANRFQDAGTGEVKLWQLPFDSLVSEVQKAEVSGGTADPLMFRLLAPTPLRQGRLLHLRGDYDGEEGAKKYYMDSRLAEAEIELAAEQQRLSALQIQSLTNMKQDASYWLGLVTFEEGDYRTAMDHLQKRTLEASPDGPWQHGARYNLARCYEALGRGDDAIALYQKDRSPQQLGNQLRAKWLQEGKIPLVDNSRPGG